MSHIDEISEFSLGKTSDFNEYQRAAMRTLSLDSSRDLDSMYATTALGLNGEAGEVAEMVKKRLFHGHQIDREKFAKELGDILWYVACGCEAIDMNMSTIAKLNIDKLKSRYPEKFESERSINKNEDEEAKL